MVYFSSLPFHLASSCENKVTHPTSSSIPVTQILALELIKNISVQFAAVLHLVWRFFLRGNDFSISPMLRPDIRALYYSHLDILNILST
jgi:hypothetical protein